MVRKKEKTIECKLNIFNSIVNLSSDMSEDDIDKAIWFWMLCSSKLDEIKNQPLTANAQLEEENKSLVEINNKLNYNIEVQVMMLNKLKEIVWDEKYKEVRDEVTSSSEFRKLTSRAWL